MSKLTEMQAKLRKGPSMLGHIKFHQRLKKHVLNLAEELDKIKAENERKEKIFQTAMDALNEIAPSTYDDVMDAILAAEKQTNA